MSVLFILICISMAVASLFLVAFVWAVKSGQFEDDYTPSLRILWDTKPTQSSKKISK